MAHVLLTFWKSHASKECLAFVGLIPSFFIFVQQANTMKPTLGFSKKAQKAANEESVRRNKEQKWKAQCKAEGKAKRGLLNWRDYVLETYAFQGDEGNMANADMKNMAVDVSTALLMSSGK